MGRFTRYPDTGDLPCRRSGGRNVVFWLPRSGDRLQLIRLPEVLPLPVTPVKRLYTGQS
jgi:hypothetical protein